MKRIAIVLFALSFVFAFEQTQAQVLQNNPKKEINHEKRMHRRELKKLSGSTVSENSKSSFAKEFGKIPVAWVRSVHFDEATFMKNGKQMKAYYDQDGIQVGTTSYVNFTDLPAIGQKNLQKYYKDYKIGKIIFFDDNEYNDTEMMLFDSQFNDEDNYFVELSKGNNKIVVSVKPNGDVSFFKQL